MLDYIKYFVELLKDSGIRGEVIKMIRELKALLWFLAVILLLYVIVLGVQVVAPNGLV